MKLQPASKRELKHISIGVLTGSVLMLAVFALIGQFRLSVLWGALLGDAAAVGNFYYLCRSVQRAAAADELKARLIMRASYSGRMLISAAALALGLLFQELFHWVAILIPLLLPRATILVMQLTGMYRPDRADSHEIRENKEEG